MSLLKTCANFRSKSDKALLSGRRSQPCAPCSAYDDRDVTTIYDAIRCCDEVSLIRAMLSVGESSCLSHESISDSFLAVARKLKSIRALAAEVGPNFESSALEVVIPWRACDVASLCGSAWPDVLGRRIVFPRGCSDSLRAKYIAEILLRMVTL